MVKIRLKRMGRRHLPFYRLSAMDSRAPRDGKVLEELGFFDPIVKDPSKQTNLKSDRIKHWLSLGAQMTDTVHKMLAKQGLLAK